MQQSGLSLLLFCVHLKKTSFHSFSTAAFASGINIAWCERSFIHTARFPEACVSERQISRIVRTISDSVSQFFVFCAPAHSCVHSRFAEQINIRSSNFFLPRITLESISYSPGCRVTRRMLCHRYATSLDETACASFHLKIRKLGEELFFRSFHRN